MPNRNLEFASDGSADERSYLKASVQFFGQQLSLLYLCTLKNIMSPTTLPVLVVCAKFPSDFATLHLNICYLYWGRPKWPHCRAEPRKEQRPDTRYRQGH